ncbi:MAG: signal peptidase I [Nanoarchaeota archaeon]
MSEFKRWLKKTWKFLWDDDSVLSWIVNIIVAFILIKFVIYPGIGFMLGTSHPIVAVVSGSMEHKTVHPCDDYNSVMNRCMQKDTSTYWICDKEYDSKKNVDLDFFWEACGEWYENKNITKSEFNEYPLKNGFNTGDIILLKGSPPEEIEKGDVIVFYASKNYPIIHRVVEKYEENGTMHFNTKGDHNSDAGTDDKKITSEQIIGKATLRVPYVGWIKLGAYRLIQNIVYIFA